MPDAVCDTSPLLYLHLTAHLDVLFNLYQQIVVPSAVVSELRQGELQGYDVPALAALPWASEEPVSPADLQRVSQSLDTGEREAIALALTKPDPLLILDDAAARTHAKSLEIPFTGTLGVVVKAKHAGLISAVVPCPDELNRAGFYLDAHVRATIHRLAGERP